MFAPTVIASETAPDGVLAGTSTFTCITPETNPGASPEKATVAGWSPISAVTGNKGFGIWLVVAQPLEHVTAPVTPAGDVCPSPVMNTWTMLPAGAGFEA